MNDLLVKGFYDFIDHGSDTLLNSLASAWIDRGFETSITNPRDYFRDWLDQFSLTPASLDTHDRSVTLLGCVYSFLLYNEPLCDIPPDFTINGYKIYDPGMLFLHAWILFEKTRLPVLADPADFVQEDVALMYALVAQLKRPDDIQQLFHKPLSGWLDVLQTILLKTLALPSDMSYEQAQALVQEKIQSAYPNAQGLARTLEQLVESLPRANTVDVVNTAMNTSYLQDKPADEFAFVDHAHPEFLQTTDVAINARALKEGESVYTASSFANAVHEHSEYVKEDDVKEAHYLYDGTALLRASDFAPIYHTHEQYATQYDPPKGARFLTDGSHTFGESADIELAKKEHTHHPWDGTSDPPKTTEGYVAHLHVTEAAVASYKLNGKVPNEFALASHTHDYVTPSLADTLRSDGTTENVKGIDTLVLPENILQTYHVVVGRVAVNGSATIPVPNPRIVHLSIETGKGDMPRYELKGDRVIVTTSAPMSVTYMILYEPAQPPEPKRD